MALTSILAPVGDRAVFLFSRGNVGVLEDIVASGQVMSLIPEVTGGGGGETSHVF